jgi:N6-L-threonylcarbamoyladenine synthase
MKNVVKIVAIETSCDDTCVAVLEAKKLKTGVSFKILSSVVHTQDIHNQYGGVYPAMAKREHIKNITPVFEKAIKDAKSPNLDAIAVTVGPGLEPALWVGITFAKELGEKMNIPVIPVNHMEGHIFSIFPDNKKTFAIKNSKAIFPSLSLLISGGHTELVLSKDFQKYEIIGSTRDDAAGEAFDKVARMLGLAYPGGPEVSRLAAKERKVSKVSSSVTFPRPMIHSKDYDFSFSGLKTAVLYHIRDHGPLTDKLRSKIAKEFEDAVIEVLVSKTLRAVKEYKIKTLIVGGGVSANEYLKKMLLKNLKKIAPGTKVHFPVKSLTGDNALMIAIAGYFQYNNMEQVITAKKLTAQGNLSL